MRVPFGLSNAPSYFSSVINNALYDVLGPSTLTYMDDIVIVTKDNDSHLKKLEEVLHALADSQLKLKIRKCNFFTQQVKFLGYKLTPEGLTMDETRTKSLENMPDPTNKRELQAFPRDVQLLPLIRKRFFRHS